MSSVVASALAFCAFSWSFEEATRLSRSAEVSDQLREVSSSAGMLEEARCCERSGGDAASILCIHCGDAGVGGGQLRRSRLTNYLMLCQCKQTANADSGDCS